MSPAAAALFASIQRRVDKGCQQKTPVVARPAWLPAGLPGTTCCPGPLTASAVHAPTAACPPPDLLTDLQHGLPDAASALAAACGEAGLAPAEPSAALPNLWAAAGRGGQAAAGRPSSGELLQGLGLKFKAGGYGSKCVGMLWRGKPHGAGTNLCAPAAGGERLAGGAAPAAAAVPGEAAGGREPGGERSEAAREFRLYVCEVLQQL